MRLLGQGKGMKNYGLVLPKNYISIDETEMEYVDGGWNGWWNSTWFMGALVDTALLGISSYIFGWATTSMALARAGKVTSSIVQPLARAIVNVMGKIFSVLGKSLTSSALSGMTGFLTNSIVAGIFYTPGNLIAEAFDSLDGKNNGYCFG